MLERSGLDETYDLLADPADGSTIVCAALVRKGLLRGEPAWVNRFPAGLRLESSSTEDPQAPEIVVGLTGFSRPVLSFEVALREAPPLTRVYVAHLKSKLPAQVDEEGWHADDPERYKPHRTALGAALSPTSTKGCGSPWTTSSSPSSSTTTATGDSGCSTASSSTTTTSTTPSRPTTAARAPATTGW